MNKIDTQVRHVTQAGANLFAELGFAPDDTRRYQAESREQIDHILLLKEQLMGGVGVLDQGQSSQAGRSG